MSQNDLCKRYALLILGLFINAVGVSLIIKAQLGSPPITSVPYTLSMLFPISIGIFTFILNVLLVIGVIILKREFKKIELIQIPISFIFGYFIDLTLSLLSFINPTAYLLRIEMLLIGCIILALGISIELIANVIMLAGEAFVQALSFRLNKEFGKTKIAFDVTLIIFSGVVSYFCLHEIVAVREGTILSALIVGLIVKIFNEKLRFMNDKLLNQKLNAEDSEVF